MIQNRFIGATFIVAGTTIGAGMLALPLSTYMLGLWPTLFLVLFIWAFMYQAALLTVRLNLQVGNGVTIAKLAHQTWGKPGDYISSFSLLFLFYALLSAYTVGGSSLIHEVLYRCWHVDIPHTYIMVAFTLLFGGLTAISLKGMDYTNRILLIIKISAFIWMMVVLLSNSNFSTFTTISSAPWSSWAIAIPVIFTSFGFHGSIPSLVNYLHGDEKAIRKSILWGSLIPVGIYTLWLIATFSNMQTFDKGHQPTLGQFVAYLSTRSSSHEFSLVVDIFAILAIITSYFGVSLGLLDFYREKLTKSSTSVLKCGLATFMLPLLVAIMYPEGFIQALGYAAIALSLLSVILPCFIAWKQPTSKFSKKMLGAMLTGGISIIIIEFFK